MTHIRQYLLLLIILVPQNAFAEDSCSDKLAFKPAVSNSFVMLPREIDPAKTFGNIVNWIYDEIILKRKAPGLVVGISGTDSLVAFLAAAKAYEKAGRPERVAGIHFAPSEEAIDANPAAEAHLWFSEQVIPWLKKMTPKAQIIVDTSIDFRQDGLRWGALMDWSVVQNARTRAMRPPEEQFWVVGTRNKTEEALFNYSSISRAASIQVLTHLWKSEILQLSKYLQVPDVAVDKSCEVDCVCGRMRLPANNIPEVDALLMVRLGLLSEDYVLRNIPKGLRIQLSQFIETQIAAGQFKRNIPHVIDSRTAQVDESLDLIWAGLKYAISSKFYPHIYSKLISQIAASGRTTMAADLVSTPSKNRTDWIPEALALFNTPGLSVNQQQQMIASVFALDSKDINPNLVKDISYANARLGNYGFSFPQWRFLTQKLGQGESIAEEFGMKRLSRPTDVRDSKLDTKDPNRDELGPGFFTQESNWYIEYRRSYIAIQNFDPNNRVTLVIRNSAPFFGRDRLSNAVYVSFEEVPVGDLQNLTAESLRTSSKFAAWQDAFKKPEAGLFKRVNLALDHLDKFNDTISKWLLDVGREPLIKFLESRVGQMQSELPPLYIAVVRGNQPSWQPDQVKSVTADLIEELRKGVLPFHLDKADRVVLMTGENGDFP